MMLKNRITTFVLATFLLLSCARVPVTDRRQLNLVNESQLMAMSADAYQDFKSNNKILPASDPRVQNVRRIGDKIAAQVECFLKNTGDAGRVDDFNWEFNVTENETVNAWAMAGGKVMVYTGILDVADTDAELAAVMGHEIAHAIARHGNERMSQALAVQGVGMSLSGIMGQDPSLGEQLLLQSYGVASALGTLSYSRKHESEADKLGLVFMYLAGYDPAQAIKLWEDMQAQSQGQPPEFLSTHPHHDTRINDIREYLPEVKTFKNKGC